jgi:hypothetical protein
LETIAAASPSAGLGVGFAPDVDGLIGEKWKKKKIKKI